MSVHSAQTLTLSPAGPTLGYQEGQCLLREASRLLASGDRVRLKIDLQAVRWMNGPGLNALIAAQRQWRSSSRSLHFANLPPQIKNLNLLK